MRKLAKPNLDSTKNEIIPAKPDPLLALLAELEKLRTANEKQQEYILKLENKILSLRNERAAALQWLGWLRGHVAASDIFAQPGWVAETAWKNPPKSWREGGEGGRIVPGGLPVKEFSGNNSAFFRPDDERELK